MYHVSAQGVDERMINVHYYYYIVAIAKRLGLIQKNVGQKSGEWTIMRKLTRQSKRTRQKKKRGGRKGDSNDSLPFQTKGDIRLLRPPFGGCRHEHVYTSQLTKHKEEKKHGFA